MRKVRAAIFALIAVLSIFITGCGQWNNGNNTNNSNNVNSGTETVSVDNIPEYTDSPYIVINNNMPFFTEKDYTEESFETYSALDALGRCGIAYANVGTDIMPTEERKEIGHIKPSGWQMVKYDIVDGNYLYNRCHLIGFQLTGENANEENLITGTRYFNVKGMLPFENMVADYVKENEHHVLYRVTPMYEGDNLVAGGVLMEAWSVEDEGEGICFNVYVYNVQPGIKINYATGESCLADDGTESGNIQYIINLSSKKFHFSDCSGVKTMKEENREVYTGSREDLLKQGYEPCGTCNP